MDFFTRKKMIKEYPLKDVKIVKDRLEKYFKIF